MVANNLNVNMHSSILVFNFTYTFCFSFYRNEKSFICNYKEHWFTVRKLGKQVTLSFFLFKIWLQNGGGKEVASRPCLGLLQAFAAIYFNSNITKMQLFVNVSLGKDPEIPQ